MASLVNVRVAYIRPEGYDNLKEWCKNKNNVYIGRKGVVIIDGKRYPPNDSKWCNPYKITENCSRKKALTLYKKMILESTLVEDLHELKNKNLGCWCKPEQCHGDILLELINTL